METAHFFGTDLAVSKVRENINVSIVRVQPEKIKTL